MRWGIPSLWVITIVQFQISKIRKHFLNHQDTTKTYTEKKHDFSYNLAIIINLVLCKSHIELFFFSVNATDFEESLFSLGFY